VLGLIGHTGTVGDHARPALALPETLNAVVALRELQTQRQQLALVVSEHGGIEGIIAVEDLIEELVGEIYDEHDRDILAVEHQPDGSVLLPGTFPLHDLEDLGIDIPDHPDVTTDGGLIVDQLGRLPKPGDQADIHGLHLEILTVRHRAPERIRLQQDSSEGGTDRSGTVDGSLEATTELTAVRPMCPAHRPGPQACLNPRQLGGVARMVMATSVGPHDDAMVPITIVVPVDGSALSGKSVPLAHQLAVRFHADVRTVTVRGDGDEVAADLVLDGDPAGALLDHLTDGDRTLVCMSSHGHGGIRRRLIGSVAEQLIRGAPTPVIVTGPQLDPAEVGVPRTLLAGIADSPRRSKLLQLLAAWAPLLGARVELAHVRSPSAAELYVTRTTGQLAPDRPDLDQLARQLRAEGVPATSHALPGSDPVAGLLSLADRVASPALLAVDSHHTGERVHHDVAYQLIRGSRWPVLATLGT
jgi:nucleotide-binding universal stress UspA family protein